MLHADFSLTALTGRAGKLHRTTRALSGPASWGLMTTASNNPDSGASVVLLPQMRAKKVKVNGLMKSYQLRLRKACFERNADIGTHCRSGRFCSYES